MTEHQPIEHLDFNPTYTCEVKWAKLGHTSEATACEGMAEFIATFEDLHHYSQGRRLACGNCVRVMGEQDFLIDAERI